MIESMSREELWGRHAVYTAALTIMKERDLGPDSPQDQLEAGPGEGDGGQAQEQTGQGPGRVHEGALAEGVEEGVEGYSLTSIGVTRRGDPIRALIGDGGHDLATTKIRVLLVGGESPDGRSVEPVLHALRWFASSDAAKTFRERFSISGVPCVNPSDPHPDGRREDGKPARGVPIRRYPPEGPAYGGRDRPEGVYLWRWIGMHAPDLVVQVEPTSGSAFLIPADTAEDWKRFREVRRDTALLDARGLLCTELPRSSVCGTGKIPALMMKPGPTAGDGAFLAGLLEGLNVSGFTGLSAARTALLTRLKRSPGVVARQLARVYGHRLRQVVYIPALSLIGRIRLGELTGEPSHLADVERSVAPYFDGEKPTKPRSGSGLSGHLVFCELARVTKGKRRDRYLALARNAADLAFDTSGKIRAPMPFHSQMSDALFMGGPILSRVGRLSGDGRYLEACVAHLRAMRRLVLRDDGLYRHSPLDEAAWGRGNGFPAIGLAMCLTDFPEDHPQREQLLGWFRAHMTALARHQDRSGCWHQVIDRAESYRELTATCMITYAMVRGLRSGWLARDEFETPVRRAWHAIRTRVASDGRLVDVCTGTGKQKNLRAYYDRKAILGKDDRGGAMALLAATEMLRWEEDGRSGK